MTGAQGRKPGIQGPTSWLRYKSGQRSGRRAPGVLYAVDEGTPVISRRQERSIGGTPWSLQTVFYPMEFATGGGATDLLVPGDISGGYREGVLKYLESTLGVKQAG